MTDNTKRKLWEVAVKLAGALIGPVVIGLFGLAVTVAVMNSTIWTKEDAAKQAATLMEWGRSREASVREWVEQRRPNEWLEKTLTNLQTTTTAVQATQIQILQQIAGMQARLESMEDQKNER